MNKSVIPNEVADAIEYVRWCGVADDEIIRNCFGGYVGSTCPKRKVLGFSMYYNPTLITSAIINGYEREQTPEQRAHAEVRKIYEAARNNARKTRDPECSEVDKAYARGIKFTLDTLGVEISGVNAE